MWTSSSGRASGCLTSIAVAVLACIGGAPSRALASDLCDPAAGVIYAPGIGVSGLVLFEDLWNRNGDLDFNDQAIAYNYEFLLDSSGNVVTMQATINLLAVGAGLHNGAYLHLPLPRASTPVTVVDQNNNAVQAIQTETDLVIPLVKDTRSLFSQQYEFINTQTSQDVESGTPLMFTITFTNGAALDTSASPFDLFIARSNDFTYQIHLPQYAGTDAMNTSLFGQGDDRSNQNLSANGGVDNTGRWFVNENGLPWALTVPQVILWPQEKVSIENVYTDLSVFASSAGKADTDWYTDTGHINTSLAFTGYTGSCVGGSTITGLGGATIGTSIGSGGSSTSACIFQPPPTPQSVGPDLFCGNMVSLVLNSVLNPGSTGQAPICANFSITPYALGPNGTQTLDGTTLTIEATSPTTTANVGCNHTPGVSPDYRYVVTATNFHGCPTSVGNLDPAQQSFNVDINCTPGTSISETVTADAWLQPLSTPTVNTTPVNPNTPPTGCEISTEANGLISFGQSYLYAANGPHPSVYTGIGNFASGGPVGTAIASGSLTQSEGTAQAGSVTNAYFDGTLTEASLPVNNFTFILQAFVQPCPSGETTIQPLAAECLSEVITGTNAHGQLTYSSGGRAQIADVFVAWPGSASVSAVAYDATNLTLYTSLGGPHLASLPSTEGSDELTSQMGISFSPNTLTGVYGSLVHSDELLAVVQSATAGDELVVLTLNDTTGVWSKGTPIPLSTFTTEEEQAIGLFGSGGCFPTPIPACASTEALTANLRGAPAPTRAAAHPREDRNTVGPTGSVTFSPPTDYRGDVIDASNPLQLSSDPYGSYDDLNLAFTWTASGLPSGQSAYVAVTLCNPWTSTYQDTNPGSTSVNITQAQLSSVPSPCLDGNYSPITTNSLALAPFPADGSGGVIETPSPIELRVADFVSPPSLTSWTIPVSIWLLRAPSGTDPTPTPDPSKDTLIASNSLTLPLTETHTGQTNETTITTAAVPAGIHLANGTTTTTAGLTWTIDYQPGADYDFLYGANTMVLLPPKFSPYPAPASPASATAADTAIQAMSDAVQMVDGSLVDVTNGVYGSATYVPAAAVAESLNSGQAGPFYVQDPTTTVSRQVPTFTINNLFIRTYSPDFRVTWWSPAATVVPASPNPTVAAPRTYMYPQAELLWAGQTFTGVYYGVNGTIFDISPISQATIGMFLYPRYGDSQYPFQANYGPDPADTAWMFHQTTYQGSYEFGMGTFVQTSAQEFNQIATTGLLNPDYVMKLPSLERVVSASIASGVPTDTQIFVSTDPSCGVDVDTGVVGSWTQITFGTDLTPAQTPPTSIGGTPTPDGWGSVQCIRYQYQGFSQTTYNQAFQTALDDSVYASETNLETINYPTPDSPARNVMQFWATADNVIPDGTNAWGASSKAIAWKDGTEIQVYDSNTTTSVGVPITFGTWGIAWGLPLPDMAITFTIPPNAVFEPIDSTWFGHNQHDLAGTLVTPTCSPTTTASDGTITVNGNSVTCTWKGPTADCATAVPIPNPAGTSDTNALPGCYLVTSAGGDSYGSHLFPHYEYKAATSYNGETPPHSISASTTASWLGGTQGAPYSVAGPTYNDTITGPTSLSVDECAGHNCAPPTSAAALTSTAAGSPVPFDVSFGAAGTAPGAAAQLLGDGNVAVYDFIGKDYTPSTTGGAGTLSAQTGCVVPVATAVTYIGARGGTTSPNAPSIYYTTGALTPTAGSGGAPPTFASTAGWTQLTLTGNTASLPAGVTAIKVVPNASIGGTLGVGALLPSDGTETVEVTMSGPQGLLCNSAALTAQGAGSALIAIATGETQVTLTTPCDSTPWPQVATGD